MEIWITRSKARKNSAALGRRISAWWERLTIVWQAACAIRGLSKYGATRRSVSTWYTPEARSTSIARSSSRSASFIARRSIGSFTSAGVPSLRMATTQAKARRARRRWSLILGRLGEFQQLVGGVGVRPIAEGGKAHFPLLGVAAGHRGLDQRVDLRAADASQERQQHGLLLLAGGVVDRQHRLGPLVVFGEASADRDDGPLGILAIAAVFRLRTSPGGSRRCRWGWPGGSAR